MASDLCDGCKTIIPALTPIPTTRPKGAPRSAWKIIKHGFHDGMRSNCHLCVLILFSLSPQQRLDLQCYQLENARVGCLVGFMGGPGDLVKMSAVFSPKEEELDVPGTISIWFELVSLRR